LHYHEWIARLLVEIDLNRLLKNLGEDGQRILAEAARSTALRPAAVDKHADSRLVPDVLSLSLYLEHQADERFRLCLRGAPLQPFDQSRDPFCLEEVDEVRTGPKAEVGAEFLVIRLRLFAFECGSFPPGAGFRGAHY